MKKGKFFVTMLASVSLLMFGALTTTACAGGEPEPEVEQFNVTWNIASHAHVAADGFTSLPEKVEKGTKLSLAVSVDDGYTIDKVKANGSSIRLKDERYTFAVNKDTAVDVSVKETIGRLEVTKNPDKLLYYAGDELDLTGMEVKVSYETGRQETIPYGDGGYTVYPTAFTGGETSFEVSYGGANVTVNLEKTVEYLVTIDPNGGTIAQAYLNDLAGRNLHNYQVAANGVITFTYYNNLSTPVALPTSEQMSKTNNSFMGWSSPNPISNGTGSVTTRASWQVELVEISSVDLVVEDNVPYLIVNATFRASNEVYLFLKEGNKHIELKGDDFTGQSGQQLAVKFDLRKLSDKGEEFEGAWMDIRFNAVYEGKDESMELFVGNGSNITYPKGKVIDSNHIKYTFATYNGMLKVYFSISNFDFTLAGGKESFDGAEKDALIITGQTFRPSYFGKFIAISWWSNNETAVMGGQIDSEGRFTIKYDLSIFDLGVDSYCHLYIYEDASMSGSAIYGGANTNLLIADITNEFPNTAAYGNSGSPFQYFKYVGEVSGYTYIIGHRWEGLMLRVVDESTLFEMTTAYLTMEDNSIYFNLEGNCGSFFTNDNFVYEMYIQHNNNADSLGWDAVLDPKAFDHKATVSNGTFKMTYCISDGLQSLFKSDDSTRWGLLSKVRLLDDQESNLKEIKPTSVGSEVFELDGVRYSTYMDNSDNYWGIAHIIMEKIA